MIDFEKYMIVEEGFFFGRAKAQKEKAAQWAQKFQELKKAIIPKIKPILLNTQNAVYTILKQHYSKIKSCEISKRDLDSQDYGIDSLLYFCSVNPKVDYSEEKEFERLSDDETLGNRLYDVIENCAKRCCELVKKIEGCETARYTVHDDVDAYYAISMSIDI